MYQKPNWGRFGFNQSSRRLVRARARVAGNRWMLFCEIVKTYPGGYRFRSLLLLFSFFFGNILGLGVPDEGGGESLDVVLRDRQHLR